MTITSTKKSSSDLQKRRTQIIGRLAVQWMSEITPEDYGANNISAALDRWLLINAVHKCEADGAFCSSARLQREARIPVSNVRRALADLVEKGVLVQVGRRFGSNPSHGDQGRSSKQLGAVVDAILMAAKELAELDGSRLLITTNGSKRVLNRAEPS